MTKIFISAGDLSGEQHAARLMAELRRIVPDVEFHGLGGRAMQREGLRPIVPLEEISVVGFWEVMKKYSYFRKLLNQCKDMLAGGEFDAFIPVDYPGFNIPLAGHARSKCIPTIYFIAPQLWAWGRHRTRKLTGCVDRLLIVFPFEEDYFRKFNIPAEYIGHPILDDPDFDDVDYSIEGRPKRIALLPGSRRQEIERHSPLFAELIELSQKELPGYKFGVAASSLLPESLYEPLLGAGDCELFTNSRELMKQSRAGVVKTGTSTLEAALCGMPFTMIYRTSPLTFRFGKYLVNLDHLSLVNILSKREIVREFVQSDATAANIAAEISRLVEDKSAANRMSDEFRSIRSLLGGKGASRRAAEIIADYL
ncbi:MAG: lipid-A-disaccharide synthase [Candidatus Kapaibacterium sp.]